MTGHELDMSQFPDRELDNDEAELLDRWLRTSDDDTELDSLEEAWERGLRNLRDQNPGSHTATPGPDTDLGQVIPLRPTRRRFRLASLAAAAAAIVTVATIATSTQGTEQNDIALPATTTPTTSTSDGPGVTVGPPSATQPSSAPQPIDPTEVALADLTDGPPVSRATTTSRPFTTTTTPPRTAPLVTLTEETDGNVRITLVQPLPDGQVYRARLTTPTGTDPIDLGTAPAGTPTTFIAPPRLDDHPILVVTREASGAPLNSGEQVLTVDLRTVAG